VHHEESAGRSGGLPSGIIVFRRAAFGGCGIDAVSEMGEEQNKSGGEVFVELDPHRCTIP
jgi:hypothetical protein